MQSFIRSRVCPQTILPSIHQCNAIQYTPLKCQESWILPTRPAKRIIILILHAEKWDCYVFIIKRQNSLARCNAVDVAWFFFVPWYFSNAAMLVFYITIDAWMETRFLTRLSSLIQTQNMTTNHDQPRSLTVHLLLGPISRIFSAYPGGLGEPHKPSGATSSSVSSTACVAIFSLRSVKAGLSFSSSRLESFAASSPKFRIISSSGSSTASSSSSRAGALHNPIEDCRAGT